MAAFYYNVTSHTMNYVVILGILSLGFTQTSDTRHQSEGYIQSIVKAAYNGNLLSMCIHRDSVNQNIHKCKQHQRHACYLWFKSINSHTYKQQCLAPVMQLLLHCVSHLSFFYNIHLKKTFPQQRRRQIQNHRGGLRLQNISEYLSCFADNIDSKC